MSTTKLMTADELLHLPDDGWRYELIEGVLIRMSPANGWHAAIESALAARIWTFVHQHHLGEVYSGDPGFFFGRSPDTVLAPDIAFVRHDRLPSRAEQGHFMPIVPDLALEILSPSNTRRDMADKIRRYLAGGVRLIWVVNIEMRSVTMYEAGQPPVELGDHDTLDGGDVLPGFACR